MVLPGTNQTISSRDINTELNRDSSNTFSTNDSTFRELLASNTTSQPVSWSELRGRAFKVFNITSNTVNFNVKAQLQALGWSNVNQAVAFVNVASGSIVYSSNTDVGAIESGVGYVPTSKIKIHVEPGAFVVGMGGNAGQGGYGNDNDTESTGSYSGSGMQGGTAIVTQANTSIINQGVIAGGGGGGAGGSGGYTTPPTPSPSPCFAGDTLILMADGTKKRADELVENDVLMTLTDKGGILKKLHITKLGEHRRFINLQSSSDAKVLRITDDHEMWIDNGIEEKFGVYNYNGWLYEELQMYSYLSGDDLYDVEVLLPYRDYKFAVNTKDGWVNTRAKWELNCDPNEDVYCIEMDSGMAFIGDDFVICNQDWSDVENDNIHWSPLNG